jgi:hypothetical protein
LIIGFLVLAGLVSVRLGLAGAVLAFLTPFVTLSFLVTTPEAWVPALGDAQHGFPYLSGAGRLVLKDAVILAGGAARTRQVDRFVSQLIHVVGMNDRRPAPSNGLCLRKPGVLQPSAIQVFRRTIDARQPDQSRNGIECCVELAVSHGL